jgi:catechol 2,3-dioxygenase-like lactoylglutathione lyase family enzyme
MRPHLSLNVRDVQSSVEFYRKVFGVTPQKQTVDYAKFDLTTPPLNFSLVSSADSTRPPTASLSPDVSPSQSPAASRCGSFPWPKPAWASSFQTDVALSRATSAVNHLGIEVDDPGEVAAWERRLREQGILAKVQYNVSCCYARQDKVWFADPDGISWEVFTVLEQLPLTTPLKDTGCCVPASGPAKEPAACGCS